MIAAERAATAAEAELRRAEDRRAAAIDRLAAAAAAARARRPRANPGARRPRASPAPRTAAAPARRSARPRPLVAIDERPPWNSCGRRGISAAEERWTPEPRPPPEPSRFSRPFARVAQRVDSNSHRHAPPSSAHTHTQARFAATHA